MKLSWKGKVSIALGVVLFFFLTWILYEKRASARDAELGQRLRDCIVSEIDFSGMNGLEALEAFHDKLVEIDPWFENVSFRYDLDIGLLEGQIIQARLQNFQAYESLRELFGGDFVEKGLTGVTFTSRNGDIIVFEINKGYQEPLGARFYTFIHGVLWEIDASLSGLIFGNDSIPADPFGGGPSARLGLTDWM